MQIYDDVADLERVTGGHIRWRRAAQAIRRAPEIPEGAMHSIGDSLTYVRTRRRHDTALLTGHRRYVEVIAAGNSPVRLEIAAKSDLTSCADYSDLTDREHFHGEADALELAPGQIVVVEIDEAVRYPEEADSPAVVVHLSVEAMTFHNK